MERLGKVETSEDKIKYEINLFSGLYYQRMEQPEKALEKMSNADGIAPPEEKYKTSNNIGNIYMDLAKHEAINEKALGDYDKAEKSFMISDELAKKQNVIFWQPRFSIGTILLLTEKKEESVKAFIESYQLAQTAGEGNSFLQYLPTVKNIKSLCSSKRFSDIFPKVCVTK